MSNNSMLSYSDNSKKKSRKSLKENMFEYMQSNKNYAIDGVTLSDLCAAFPGTQQSTISGRLSELLDEGYVYESSTEAGQYYPTYSTEAKSMFASARKQKRFHRWIRLGTAEGWISAEQALSIVKEIKYFI